MLLLIASHAQKLWDTWNIRGLIILSLCLQSFLILFAPLRKQRGGKWIIMIPLWVAYLFADWVATFTIGLMLRADRSDILAFWAPFLLLHLGGPDTITSFSLEDNEFWIRHLLELILQVGSTIYVILQSLTHNKLWLPTLLVLIAGVIKYAERNRAFYLASFDHFGDNWTSLPKRTAMCPIPVQFEKCWPVNGVRDSKWPLITAAVGTIGAMKSFLVGPPMTKLEQRGFSFLREEEYDHNKMLRIIQINLGLLYEFLHTKLPVVDSKIGYICRTVYFGCILGALVSFSILLKKYYHDKLGEFDICLTYGLLIGALLLDLISIWLLMFSDWIIIRQYPGKENYDEFIERRRWSNVVPQLNIFDCRFENKDGDYPNKFVDFLGTSSLFETIRRNQCVSLKNFVGQDAWKFIFSTLQEADIGEAGRKLFGSYRILTAGDTDFARTLNKFEHMERLLIWHIVTEICYRTGCLSVPSPSTSNHCFDHRKICKLISDYMFYLLVTEPNMAAISPKNLKIVFEAKDGPWKWPSSWEKGSNVDKLLTNLYAEYANKGIDYLLKKDVNTRAAAENIDIDVTQRDVTQRLDVAGFLAKELLRCHPGLCPWDLMGRLWVEILCYAAIHCQPIVHARQVSRGGQLLTLVWLLINYLGLTPPPSRELF